MSVYVRGPPQRAARSYLPGVRRVEDRLPPLLPGPVGLVDLPGAHALVLRLHHVFDRGPRIAVEGLVEEPLRVGGRGRRGGAHLVDDGPERAVEVGDRKSTRLNSSHQIISYAVFCLKKKTQT